MRPRFIAVGIRILVLVVAANLGVAAVCFAQGAPPSLKGTPPAATSSQNGQAPSAQPDQNAPPAAPKIDPAEEADYKAFFDAGSRIARTRGSNSATISSKSIRPAATRIRIFRARAGLLLKAGLEEFLCGSATRRWPCIQTT